MGQVAPAASRPMSRRLPVELSADRRMARRVKRLGLVSMVALGLIWGLAAARLGAPLWVNGMLRQRSLVAGMSTLHTVEFERRRVPATVVETPFFDPERKRKP